MGISRVYSCRVMVSSCNLEYYEHTGILLDHGWIEIDILLSIGAPDGFIIIDDIVGIFVVGIDEGYQNLFFGVSEWTKISIVADSWIFVVELAELCFISGGVVELLNFVVRFLAVAVHLLAGNMRIVVEIRTSSIFLVVEVEADLAFVLIWVGWHVPLRVQRMVLKVAMSNLKNSPC